MKQLKNRKNPGPHKITNERLNYDGNPLVEIIDQLENQYNCFRHICSPLYPFLESKVFKLELNREN